MADGNDTYLLVGCLYRMVPAKAFHFRKIIGPLAVSVFPKGIIIKDYFHCCVPCSVAWVKFPY